MGGVWHRPEAFSHPIRPGPVRERGADAVATGGRKGGSPTYVMGLPGVERGVHPEDAMKIISVSGKSIMNFS